MVAASSPKNMVALASPLRLFICVCLSSSLPSSPGEFVRVLSHCCDDRRIVVRLPVRVGDFSLCRCFETHRQWVGLRQETISPVVSQRGVQLSSRLLLLKDQKEWSHTSACLCVIPAGHRLYLAIFYHDAAAPFGLRPAYYRGVIITHKHTTVFRTPLDE
jgi:hypothetical protein